MKLYNIETGNFKLDGGAMFGVVPKSIWNRAKLADDNNMIDISARSLLIEDGNRLILIDSGLGDKQSEKFFSHYHLWGDDSLEKSLYNCGFHPDNITDVFMSHLHFDHSGGNVKWNKDHTAFEPVFKNAKIWTNKKHWEWATKPNQRERASFLSENLLPTEEFGQLFFVEKAKRGIKEETELGFSILFVDGHTEKQMIPIIKYKDKTICFTADLIPTVGHIPIPYVAGYDTRPLKSMNEKEAFLDMAVENNFYLFMQHDAKHEIITIQKTEKGFALKDVFSCEDIL